MTVFLGLKHGYARPASLTLPELRLIGFVPAFDKPKPGLFSDDDRRIFDMMGGSLYQGHGSPWLHTVRKPGGDPKGDSVWGPGWTSDQLIRVDIVFKPDSAMTMDYVVRVRDHRGILHDMGLQAPPGEIVMFMPTVYMP